VGALIAAYAGVQFFAAPLLGALSDQFGRRPVILTPVILTSVFGIGLDYILLALAPSMWWLFLGRLIAGATSANVAAATAYIADVSSQDDRSSRFGLVLAGIGLSQAVTEGFLLTRITARLGDQRTALLGHRAAALGYATLALAGWMLAPAVVLLALGGLAIPSVRAMVSGRGGVDNQGEMQGVLTAVEGLTAVAAPLVTAWLFYPFTSPVLPVHFAGAPFMVAAGGALFAGSLPRRL